MKRIKASNGVTMFLRTTGFFKTDLSFMLEGGASRKVRIPIPFYVIRHPQGIVLFDSGLGRNFQGQIDGWWMHRLFQGLLPHEFQPSDAAVRQLKTLRISPESVRMIIVSHMHLDHIGGLGDFPKAKVVVTRREWEHANVDRWRARLRGVMAEQLEGVMSRLRIVDLKPGKSFRPFEGGLDLFGDGSLILLSTPGHTPGHQSVLVTLNSGMRVLLAGDAVWVRENYQWPAPKGWIVRNLEENCRQAWKTTLKVREFAETNQDVLIIPGHDPFLWKALPDKMN